MAARKKREPASVARKLMKELPRLSPLLREGFHSLWTEAQCDAWGRRTRAVDVVRQANDWLAVAHQALESERSADVPYSRQRLAWLAALTAALEDELAGRPPPAAVAAREARTLALAEARQLRARLFSRMVLLLGGDEARAAALAVANHGARTDSEVQTSLLQGALLLTRWREEARLRVLADELGLDEDLASRAGAAARALEETARAAAGVVAERGDPPSVNRVEGRVLRELRSLQVAFEAARADGLAVPKLRVRPQLKSILSARAPLSPTLSPSGERETGAQRS